MSELTVPRAPVTVGRTATIRHESPGTGELAAAFGNRLLAFGTALEADRLDREMARLKVDMTRDLGELRLQVEDMGDPDAAGAAWDAGVASIRKNYLTGTGENGRPRVDKKNEGNFGLAFDDLTNTHALAIGRRGLALRQSQRAATYYDYGNVAAAQAVTADPETQAQMIARASGGRGPNREYLFNTAAHLADLGLPDPDLDALVSRVRAITGGAGA